MGTSNVGLFARFRAGLRAVVEALDYSGFDYTLDRVGNLEREVALLRNELRMVTGAGRAGSQTEPVSSSPVEAVR
jgi:hypothetical protein